MHERLSKVRIKTDVITGVSWVRLAPTREKTVELVVNIPMLQHLVSIGEVLPEEEFYVEVISTGKWYSGTVLEAFIFCVNDVLHDVWENEKNARRVAEELIAQAFELSALMQLANTKANAPPGTWMPSA